MAKSALRRRRGTRAGSSWWGSEHKLLQSILVGIALIAVGLAGGVLVGILMYSSSPNTMSSLQDKVSNLRKPNQSASNAGAARADLARVSSNQQGLNAIASAQAQASARGSTASRQGSGSINVSGKSAPQRKKEFLQHQPEIATKGAFPHYPKDGLVDEHHDFSGFTAPGGSRFIEYIHGDSPYTYSPGESDDLARSRRVHVKKAMQHAWDGYEKFAFGNDELLPTTMSGHNNWGGFGTTLVDSLDTLWLMGLKDEFQRARDWVAHSLNHNRNTGVSVFETTIRSLGGLLSAYDWSGDEVFLDQAKDLGKRLFPAIEKSPSGIPYGRTNLVTGNVQNLGWSGGAAIVSEAGTLQLEYRMLARLTGNRDYKTKSEAILDILRGMNPPNGLYPYFVANLGSTPQFRNNKLTFGAMSDSLYEYMLKVWIQGGKVESRFRDMYDESMQGMHDELLQVSSPSGLVFIADKNNGQLDTKMDHLVCFMGGLLALGAYTDPLGLDSDRAQRDLKTAKALTYTCYQMYARMPTGISAEFVQFYEGKDFESGRGAPHYLLRPETVESFFVLYHLTGDPVYREWGWEAFQAIERYCRLEGGYGSLHDVRNVNQQAENKMESFFLAETLKYFYLLFDPDTPIDLLQKHVFNTEAHPVRVFPAMDAAGVQDLLK